MSVWSVIVQKNIVEAFFEDILKLENNPACKVLFPVTSCQRGITEKNWNSEVSKQIYSEKLISKI